MPHLPWCLFTLRTRESCRIYYKQEVKMADNNNTNNKIKKYKLLDGDMRRARASLPPSGNYIGAGYPTLPGWLSLPVLPVERLSC
jgi:hypothetical protein